MDPKIMQVKRLTKKFLFSLDEGVYIVSCILDPFTPEPSAPVFAEYVPLLDDRESQWQRMKDAGIDGRTVVVFGDKGDYCLWLDDFIKANLDKYL